MTINDRSLWPILLLLPMLGCDTGKIAELEKQNQELAAKLDALTKASSIDLQGKCAKQADVRFHQSGFEVNKQILASYTNHYQPKLGKCFIQITGVLNSKASVLVGVSVLDAFEGKKFAQYSKWSKDVKPSDCEVTLLPGEAKTCQSQSEFDELVKVYMEQ